LSTVPRSNTAGFTLIELMIVVVIIGILAAIALPKFSGMTKAAKEAEADPILKEVYTLQQAYYSRYNRYGSQDELKTHGFLGVLADPAVANAEERFYYIQVTANSSTDFCVVAQPTTKGSNQEVRPRSMNSAREITANATACS
jgi:type IV pilus assembly protein PilE